MAKAVVNTKTVVPARTIPAVTEETVIVTLSKDEASIISALLGACAINGPTFEIYNAFYNAGVSDSNYKVLNVNGTPRTSMTVVKG